MGKSPGRWIKTVLFGKKSSKSNISKGREKLVNKKETVVASNLSENGLALDPSPNQIVRNEEDIELQNREAENLLPGNQEIDTVESVDQDATPDPEKIRLEEAATKAQAAFRGYLARRAFRALKGIIRLQALIRGHLVRRQAVATLCSTYAIVKLQAFVRGRRARQTDVGFEIQEKCALFKPLDGKLGEPVGISTKISLLSVNTFIRKLFASSTTTMALHLQYVGGDPNSVSSWLERWSASNFWKPIPQPKKIRDSKSSRKQGNIAVGEAQISKSRRTRKLPPANFESVTVQANPESEKPKRNVRKISSQPSDPGQENPQSELEKVKRNLRKIHNPVVENAVLPEVESETPKQHMEKTTVTAGQAVLEQGVVTSKEKIKKEAVSDQVVISSKEKMKKEAVSEQGIITSNEKIKMEAVSEPGVITSNEKIKNEAVSEHGVITSHEKIKNKELLTISNAPVVEITPRPSVKKEQFNIPSYQVTLESEPLTETTTKDDYTSADEAKNELSDLPETIYKDENAPLTNGDLNHKEDKKGNENQKPTRKSSILAKQDRAESGLQSSPTLPSYMAATESAKAKLRTQGSPRFGQDGSDRNSPAGQHSLPSSTNSKISSHSPRTQRSVQAGGKVGPPKSDKAMPSSKGGNGKVIQAEWRR